MTVNYIDVIAEHILAGTPVVLYTMSSDTLSVIRALKARHGVLPAAVCDNDAAKQGQTYRGLFGLSVLSPDDAIRLYPNGQFFISSMDYRFQIMGELVSTNKLAPTQIINYEPIIKRKSCIFFEKLVCVDEHGKATFCWVADSPAVNFNADYSLQAVEFQRLRDKLIAGCGNDALPNICDSCSYICEDWYPVNPKSWWLNFAGYNVCNFKCAYCQQQNYIQDNNADAPEFDKIVRAFREAGTLAEFYSAVLSTYGEPTLHPKRVDYFSCFDGYVLIVNSNGSVFDADLFALMQNKQVKLIVSLDAGTRATYAGIKGVDCLDKVKDNLTRYSKSAIGLVIPKYIVVPGINDNEADADAFVELCDELCVSCAIIAYDQRGVMPIPENASQIMRRVMRGLESRNMLCVNYTSAETFEYVAALKNALKG